MSPCVSVMRRRLVEVEVFVVALLFLSLSSLLLPAVGLKSSFGGDLGLLASWRGFRAGLCLCSVDLSVLDRFDCDSSCDVEAVSGDARFFVLGPGPFSIDLSRVAPAIFAVLLL